MKNLLKAPTGRILRNQNFNAHFNNPNYIRNSQFDNTVRFLEDKKNGRKLVLVGTLNSSDILAQRTSKLIKDINPDSVFVQTNKNWYDKLLKNNNQIMSNKEIYDLTKNDLFENVKLSLDPRDFIFKTRFLSWIGVLNLLYSLPTKNSHPFTPGLETFKALDFAKKNDKQISYGSTIFSKSNLTALEHEKRLNFIDVVLRASFRNNKVSYYKSELEDEYAQMCIHGWENYSESVDTIKMNLLTKIIQRIIPYQKELLIDKTNETVFRELYENMDGKIIFAVVNQWNLEGIEALWRHTTDTEKKEEFINPIGDLNINGIMESGVVNDYLRRRNSKIGKTEPAVTTDYITFYHKQTTEPERERHSFFLGWDDPELEHSLYNDENKNVEYLPYKFHGH